MRQNLIVEFIGWINFISDSDLDSPFQVKKRDDKSPDIPATLVLFIEVQECPL